MNNECQAPNGTEYGEVMADEKNTSRRRLILGRRRYPRAIVDCTIALQRLDMPDVMAHAVDMSLGGIRFQCVGFKLVQGEVMQAHFHLGANAFFLFGKAVRVRTMDTFSREVGFEFSPMTSRNRSLLRRSLYGS